jgi:DNA-binding IscR family transcriptional regulator
MKLSRETEYGLMGLVHLAQQPEGTVMQPTAIAETFRKLTRYGLVRSLRGATRRHILSIFTNGITLRDVLEAIEGPGLLNGASSEITAALRRIPVSLRGMEMDYSQVNGVDAGDTPLGPRAPDCDSTNA